MNRERLEHATQLQVTIDQLWTDIEDVRGDMLPLKQRISQYRRQGTPVDPQQLDQLYALERQHERLIDTHRRTLAEWCVTLEP